jgi:hypothetical protein
MSSLAKKMKASRRSGRGGKIAPSGVSTAMVRPHRLPIGVCKRAPFGASEVPSEPTLSSALSLVQSKATRIEKKGSPDRLVFDEETLTISRGLLSAKSEYRFRVWANATMSISSNAVISVITLSPTGTSEWTSLAALFDEYRVDDVFVHLCPIVVAGNNGMNWASGGYAIASDYNDSTAPVTYNEVLEHAESHIEPLSSVYTVGSTSTNATSQLSKKLIWHAHPPKQVELASAATVATAEWVETSVSWPGSVKFIATVNGTNGDTPMQRYVEYHVRLRQRR